LKVRVPDELGSRGDAKLGEHVAKVIVDSTWAQEELGGRLLVRRSPGDEVGDLELLRRELGDGARIPPSCRLARRSKLGTSSLLPRAGPQSLEGVDGPAQLDASVGLAVGASQVLTEQQPGPGFIETAVAGRVIVKSGGELVGDRLVLGEECSTPCGLCPSPRGTRTLDEPIDSPESGLRSIAGRIDVRSRSGRLTEGRWWDDDLANDHRQEPQVG
jgi:hypothetical protein